MHLFCLGKSSLEAHHPGQPVPRGKSGGVVFAQYSLFVREKFPENFFCLHIAVLEREHPSDPMPTRSGGVVVFTEYPPTILQQLSKHLL